jgi:hypothetical protein
LGPVRKRYTHGLVGEYPERGIVSPRYAWIPCADAAPVRKMQEIRMIRMPELYGLPVRDTVLNIPAPTP